MHCKLVAKLGFDKIQIVEISFILNKINNLDHDNFSQFKIF
jgi:hypothetical protein